LQIMSKQSSAASGSSRSFSLTTNCPARSSFSCFFRVLLSRVCFFIFSFFVLGFVLGDVDESKEEKKPRKKAHRWPDNELK
jgi:hypothetical protein